MARVLIIEDEEKMARTLARVLGEEGHVTETAHDGRIGLSRALEDSFDLLIVDRMLPERSGVQIVRGLRAAEVHTPVLKVTTRKYKTSQPLFQRPADRERHPRANTKEGLEKRYPSPPSHVPQRHSASSVSCRQPYAP